MRTSKVSLCFITFILPSIGCFVSITYVALALIIFVWILINYYVASTSKDSQKLSFTVDSSFFILLRKFHLVCQWKYEGLRVRVEILIVRISCRPIASKDFLITRFNEMKSRSLGIKLLMKNIGSKDISSCSEQ